MKSVHYLLSGLFLGLTLLAQGQGVTRFEAEKLATPPGVLDPVGGAAGIWQAVLADPAASGGKYLAAAANFNVKFIFVGTGVNVVTQNDWSGNGYSWSLDNGAKKGNYDVVPGSSGPAFQVIKPIASGLPNTMHTLEVAMTTGTLLTIDAFDVTDAGTRQRIDTMDLDKMGYSGPDQWIVGAADPTSSAGDYAWSPVVGASITINFTGKAVALIALSAPNSRPYDWSIDNDAWTGKVEVAGVAGDPLRRWPFLIKNDLPDGAHTLKLTATEGTGAQAIANIDAIDTIDKLVPVELSSFNVD